MSFCSLVCWSTLLISGIYTGFCVGYCLGYDKGAGVLDEPQDASEDKSKTP